MRIESIELSWFRGAAASAQLRPGAKSMVVYGMNGAGKSSFADGLEYVVSNGKVSHLAHEFSGKRQEKGIRNTHAPEDAPAKIEIRFEQGSWLQAEIAPDGSFCLNSDPEGLSSTVQAWQLERLILRQAEVADFIHATKGQKYSVLLPLLGLADLEHAAENLRQLKQAIEERAQLAGKESKLGILEKECSEALPGLSDEVVEEVLADLAKDYVGEAAPEKSVDLLDAVESAVEERIQKAEPEQKLHHLVQQINDEDLAAKLEKARKTDRSARRMVDELVDKRIAVLEASDEFIQDLGEGLEKVACPACGRTLKVEDLASHVAEELKSLGRARETRDAAIGARKDLADAVKQILKAVSKKEVSEWLASPRRKPLAEAASRLASVDLSDPDSGWAVETWGLLGQCVPTVSSGIAAAAKKSPPSIKKLVVDQKVLRACRLLPEVHSLRRELESLGVLLRALDGGERAVREEVKRKTEDTIARLSTDIQGLWAKLHPNEPIEDVKLYMPSDAEKAIDVSLTFFGVDQPSPRITLSEGHRNSLGLCIFLALALSDDDPTRPIVLDDVVSSFDREHRGMLADIILAELAGRQVILLTHDREWYCELRLRLPHSEWTFVALRPWESPSIGIQWAKSEATFGDATALLPENLEAAGNRARAIMDTHLALAAENLRVSMRFARGERNDQRTCIEFLERITAEARARFKKKQVDEWLPYAEPIPTWEEARALLGAWANPASHTGMLVLPEAERLIRVCESALDQFRCSGCGEPVWAADQAKRERLQCTCGELQWRYG